MSPVKEEREREKEHGDTDTEIRGKIKRGKEKRELWEEERKEKKVGFVPGFLNVVVWAP